MVPNVQRRGSTSQTGPLPHQRASDAGSVMVFFCMAWMNFEMDGVAKHTVGSGTPLDGKAEYPMKGGSAKLKADAL